MALPRDAKDDRQDPHPDRRRRDRLFLGRPLRRGRVSRQRPRRPAARRRLIARTRHDRQTRIRIAAAATALFLAGIPPRASPPADDQPQAAAKTAAQPSASTPATATVSTSRRPPRNAAPTRATRQTTSPRRSTRTMSRPGAPTARRGAAGARPSLSATVLQRGRRRAVAAVLDLVGAVRRPARASAAARPRHSASPPARWPSPDGGQPAQAPAPVTTRTS